MVKMGKKQSNDKKFEAEVLEFRYSMNDWILFLNSQQREFKEKLRILDSRLKELELEKELRDRGL